MFIGNDHALLAFKGNGGNLQIGFDALTFGHILQCADAPGDVAITAPVELYLRQDPTNFTVNQQSVFHRITFAGQTFLPQLQDAFAVEWVNLIDHQIAVYLPNIPYSNSRRN